MDTTWSPYFTQPFFFNKQQNMWANRFQPTRPYPSPNPQTACCNGNNHPGSSKCFQVNQDTCQVNINLQQQKINQVTIRGQVTDCCGEPLEGCCVTLCKQCEYNGCIEYQPVQQTVTDCRGNYKFCIAPPCCCEQYKVVLAEQDDTPSGSCNVCYTC